MLVVGCVMTLAHNEDVLDNSVFLTFPSPV